jgi:ABC-type dipeptide/oligopeptide/nickel transport system permease subunit
VTATVPGPHSAAAPAEVFGWRLTFARFRRRRGALVALGVVAVAVVLAIVGPWVAPQSLQETNDVFNGPMSAAHWLGTDSIGRDELSQLLYALRESLLAAWLALAIGVVVGTLLGLVSGYAGTKVDWAVMRVVDVLMSFPGLLLIIALIGVLGTSLVDAMIALSVSFVPSFARLIRGEVLAAKAATFVEAAQVSGVPAWRIVARHIVPGVLPAFIVQLCLTMGLALIAQGGLGFLGLGVQPPHTNLGAMLQSGFSEINVTPRLILVPGITITIIAMAFNVIADGLRDALGRGTASATELAATRV